MLSLPGVTWAGPLTVNDKLDPMIRSGEWGSWNRAPDGTAAVTVVMHQDESIETGRALVEKHGGKIVGEVIGIRTLLVEMPQANVDALAAEDAVQWIEPAAPPLREANDGIRTQIGVNTVQAAPYNLNGSGIDILIYDGGIVTATHPIFRAASSCPIPPAQRSLDTRGGHGGGQRQPQRGQWWDFRFNSGGRQWRRGGRRRIRVTLTSQRAAIAPVFWR